MHHTSPPEDSAALALAAGLALGLGACGGAQAPVRPAAALPRIPSTRLRAEARASGASAPDAARAAPVRSRQPSRRSSAARTSPCLVKDVGAAAETVAPSHHGRRDGDERNAEHLSGDSTDLSGSVTISVPSDKLDDTMKRLAELGDVVSRTTSSGRRHRAVRRHRVPVGHHAGQCRSGAGPDGPGHQDPRTSWRSKSELSRRQADLEALEAQLRSSRTRWPCHPSPSSSAPTAANLADSGGGCSPDSRPGGRPSRPRSSCS